MKYGKIIMLFLCCMIAVQYGFSQDTADSKKGKDKKQKTEKKAENKTGKKTDKKEGNSETENTTEKENTTEEVLPAETVANPADSTVETKTDSTAVKTPAPAKGAKTKAVKEPVKPERPVAKPQEIKDPIDRKMKGPSGQTVYTSPHGGKYYINNIGVKTFLRGEK